MEPNISNSEKYRQERKERIAKANAKKNNESPKTKKIKRITGISTLCALVLAIVIVFLNFFGVFTRLTTVIVTKNNEKVSAVEYEYYYVNIMSNYQNKAIQYEEQYSQYYGEGAGKIMTGYDYTKTPDKQKYTFGELDKKYGKEPTWADFFESNALEACYFNRELANKAKQEKINLTKENKKQLNEYIEDIRKTAAQNDYSLNAYLRENFCKGLNEKLLREFIEIQMLTENYVVKISNKYKNSVTEEEILKEYNDNKSKYNVTDIRIFPLTSTAAVPDDNDKKSKEELKKETKKDADKVKAKAKQMLDGVTDEASFKAQAIKYSPSEQKKSYEENDATLSKAMSKAALESNVSKDAGKWVYDKNRKSADKKLFTVNNDDGSVTCYVIYIVKPSYQDNTLQPVSVRHILVSFDENLEDGKEVKVTQKLKDEKRKVAQDIFNEWKKGKATEESFGELAKTKSNDSGSAQNGGLFEDVKRSSNYVEPFKNWCIADGRKVGDTGIVETTFGYHIMYCSKISKTPEWKTTIKDSISQKRESDFLEKVLKDTKKKTKFNQKNIKKSNKRMAEKANNLIANTVKDK